MSYFMGYHRAATIFFLLSAECGADTEGTSKENETAGREPSPSCSSQRLQGWGERLRGWRWDALTSSGCFVTTHWVFWLRRCKQLLSVSLRLSQQEDSTGDWRGGGWQRHRRKWDGSPGSKWKSGEQWRSGDDSRGGSFSKYSSAEAMPRLDVSSCWYFCF